MAETETIPKTATKIHPKVTYVKGSEHDNLLVCVSQLTTDNERLRVENTVLAQERDQIRDQRDELISTLAKLRATLDDTGANHG